LITTSLLGTLLVGQPVAQPERRSQASRPDKPWCSAGPVLKKARSGAPVAAGAAPVAAGVPAVPSKDSRWRKQARTPQEASGLAGSGGNGHPSQRLRVSGPYGGGPAEAPAAATEAAGEGKPPKPGRVAGSRKEGIAADGGTASTGPKLPPHDFFLKASQKRARREADAATARETARLAAVDQQRQHAEVRPSSRWPDVLHLIPVRMLC